MIPFGEWLPDRGDFENPGLTVATNVLPKTQDSYGPFPDLTVYSNALTARCQGAFAGRSAAGNVTNFSGDATKLYTLSGATWSSVNTGFSTATDESWRFTQFGEFVIATNLTDEPKKWTLDSSSAFSQLSSGAPKARYAANINPGFLMFGNTVDGTDGAVPNRVWWSGIGDATSFLTPGSAAAQAVQSDFNDMPAGGWVQGIIGAVGGADGVVFMDTSIYRAQYQGPPDVFGFYEVERARGTPAPGSIINVGSMAFYLGEDGFYVFDGSRSIPIGNTKIDKTFYSTLDQSYFHRISSAVDPINKLVFWAYPTSSASSGNPDRILCYNWELGRWSEAEINCELIYRSLSQGYTLDSLDTYSTDLDALPFSLDSRVWTGGRLILSAFNADHKLAFFTGSNLAATLETSELTGQSGRRVLIQGVRPMVDGGTITSAIGYRDTPQASLTYTTATSAGSNGVCPQRISTRYARARVSIAAGGTWTHALGFEPTFRQEGLR